MAAFPRTKLAVHDRAAPYRKAPPCANGKAEPCRTARAADSRTVIWMGFLIRHTETGAVLFLGRVLDPR
ncbi:MAG: hypothetical protein AB1716_11500 [Planctomycetota bacterium]